MEKDELDSEELDKKSLDFKIFELKDKHPAVFDEYYKLLLEMQIESVNKDGGNPEIITTEQRRELLERAQTNVNTGHVDPKKIDGLVTKEESEKKMAERMKKSFEKYRNPSKGSQPSSDFESDE